MDEVGWELFHSESMIVIMYQHNGKAPSTIILSFFFFFFPFFFFWGGGGGCWHRWIGFWHLTPNQPRRSYQAETVQFSSFQTLDRLGRNGDMRDDSAEILFQSFLQEALVSSSSMGRNVLSLTSSFQYVLCRPQRRALSKMPWRMVLRRMWGVTCQNHASFRLLTFARRGSCRPTRKLLILLCTQSLVLCSK